MLGANAKYFLILPLFIWVTACKTSPEETNLPTEESQGYRPWVDIPEIFEQVQMQRIFPDGKSFVDYQPMAPYADLNEAYASQKDEEGFDLKAFVDEHFAKPRSYDVQVTVADTTTLYGHLNNMWPTLTREADKTPEFPSTLMPLPHPYVVPGGRFREIYYWDSYFTMQGLIVSGELDLMKSMLDNFAYFIDTLGYIPNGNRTYLATRSQPPFFSSMVMRYAEATAPEEAHAYLPQLAKEYAFWMAGERELGPENREVNRVVWLEDGMVLNRYLGNGNGPRPESYREDVELSEQVPEENRAQLFRDIRAACESGWDFSARWFADVNDLSTIRTTRILPVDLNALLYHLESTLSRLYAETGQAAKSTEFNDRAERRIKAMRKYFWSEEQAFFMDFDLDDSSRSPYITAAGMFPLYYRIATELQAEAAKETFMETLRKPGGVVTTQLPKGEQWDYPNGWAPLQWIAAIGMENYGYRPDAQGLAHDWLRINNRVFMSQHKMMEKYNVVDLNLTAGGGEYPTQDGFGWTNGVALGFIERYGMPPNPQ